MSDFVLKRDVWDVLEDVLRWPLMAIIVGVTLPIAAVNFFFFGGWLDVVPTHKKGVCRNAALWRASAK